MSPQNASRGSSMFDRGRNQSFVESEVSSIGRDLIILNWNGNGKAQDKVPVLLAQKPVDLEAPTPRIDLLDTPRAEPVIFKNVENPSIFDQEQVNFLVSSLLKSLDQSSKQEQPHLGTLPADADQPVDSEVSPELQDKEMIVSITKGKGKSRAPVVNVDLEAEPAQNLDPWVHVISTQERDFLSAVGLTRHSACSERYAMHMLPERHGYPLWLPQPDMSLPVEYRKNGVNIGDVGIITPDGGFDFLFNIWLPSSHPINPEDLPSDFDVLKRPKRTVYRQPKMFNLLGHICCGAYVSNINRQASSIEFTCNKDEGSIITLPDGASREDLKNEKSLEDFIKQSAESWYRWAAGPADRLIERDSLYLVTGCMKAKSWGIATYSSAVPAPHNVIVLSKSTVDLSEPYIWEKQGGTTARTGPYPDEDFDTTGQNQCMFIRGYKIALSEAAWKASQCADGLSLSTDGAVTSESRGSDSASSSRHPSPSSSHNLGSSGSSVQHATDSVPRSSTTNVDISRMPPKAKVWHPADELNDLLLKQFPEARVAITHDQIWCHIIEKYGSDSLSQLSHYALQLYQPLCEDNNGATFTSRIEHDKTTGQQGTTSSIQGSESQQDADASHAPASNHLPSLSKPKAAQNLAQKLRENLLQDAKRLSLQDFPKEGPKNQPSLEVNPSVIQWSASTHEPEQRKTPSPPRNNKRELPVLPKRPEYSPAPLRPSSGTFIKAPPAPRISSVSPAFDVGNRIFEPNIRVHPLLDQSSMLSFDMRLHPPNLMYRNAPLDHRMLSESATMPPIPFLSISSEALPWRIQINPSNGSIVTVCDVLDTIGHSLRQYITAADFNSLSSSAKRSVSGAYENRCRILGTGVAYEQEKRKGVKRIDFLNGVTYFTGLSFLHYPNSWRLHHSDRPTSERPAGFYMPRPYQYQISTSVDWSGQHTPLPTMASGGPPFVDSGYCQSPGEADVKRTGNQIK